MKTLLIGVLLFAQAGFAQVGGERWIPTWATSPQQPRPGPARAGAFPGAFNNQTARMIVHTSIGGHRVRVELSNAYGAAPLTVGSAHIALREKDSAIVRGSDRALMFNGKPECSIPVGAYLMSDPVALEVPKMGDLAISIYLPGDTGPATTHSTALQTTYISKQGDATAEPAISDPVTTLAWYFLKGVEVAAPANTASVVTFGDSITDGTRSTPNTNSSWPAFLARRIPDIAVLNEGIAGNRVLRDDLGVSALARFDRDVVSQPGVKWVTIMEGINDIGAGIGPKFVFAPQPNAPASEIVTADELIGGYKQMINRAHEHGIKVYGSPLTPFEGSAYYTERGNETRKSVNQWIRTAGAFDALIDFDAVTRDPNHMDKFRADYDSSDHLHPNDAGYKAMAEVVKLSLFK